MPDVAERSTDHEPAVEASLIAKYGEQCGAARVALLASRQSPYPP